MKKLTDKDAILCVSIEEAIAIRDKFGINLSDNEIKMAFSVSDNRCIIENGYLYHFKKEAKEQGFKITKASKILNKGVSKKELLRRIEKLEKVMIDNTELTVSDLVVKEIDWSQMRINNTEKSKQFSKTNEIEGIKNELTELPEKWCIKITEENVELTNNWITKDLRHTDLFIDFGFVYYNRNWTPFFDEECTEITFEQFNKWVLKEDNCKAEIPKITEVQVDCSELTKEQIQDLADIVVENGFELEKNGLYDLNGICKFFRIGLLRELNLFGIWTSLYSFKTITYQQFKDFYSKAKTLSIREVQVKVNSQEEANECAEIVKLLGYKLSTLFNFHLCSCYFSYNKHPKANVFGCYNFDERIKEISIQEFRERFGKPKEIDWSKSGQLVKNEICKSIFITDGQHTEKTFRGTSLISNRFKAGHQKTSLSKEEFKLCTEPITLSN